MYKLILLFVLLGAFANTSTAQISKSTWLLSGEASFSWEKHTDVRTAQYTQTQYQIAPSIGYFPADKFAVGLRPAFTSYKNSVTNPDKSVLILGAGPFVRYYLLSPEREFNFLAETGYLFSKENYDSDGFIRHTFSVAAGPEVFFNSSVGLKFALEYAVRSSPGYGVTDKSIRFVVGFQFHLEPDRQTN